MEMTTISYKQGDRTVDYRGTWVARDAGVVLILSELSQTFIPWHRVVKIEQSFTKSTPTNERHWKSLSQTLRSN